MTQNFTPFDLIPYLYGEARPDQINRTEAALAGDPVLRDELDELAVAQAALPKLRFNAPRRLLRSLLDYSRPAKPVCC